MQPVKSKSESEVNLTSNSEKRVQSEQIKCHCLRPHTATKLFLLKIQNNNRITDTV